MKIFQSRVPSGDWNQNELDIEKSPEPNPWFLDSWCQGTLAGIMISIEP